MRWVDSEIYGSEDYETPNSITRVRKILWIDEIPRAAEHAKNDEKVKLLLKNVGSVNSKNMVSSIQDSYSAEFDLNISPGTDKLTVGRFHKQRVAGLSLDK